MMRINKPILTNILQLNSTQTKQAIRYISTFNNNNGQLLIKSSPLINNNNNNNKGISFFKITPTAFNKSIRQYSTENKLDFNRYKDKVSKEVNRIYWIFTILFTTATGVAIYKMVRNYMNGSSDVMGIPSYDGILLLQDIYFGELKPAMEHGNPEFNALTKNNYFMDESGIRNHSSRDTTTLIVPIKQKKTRHDLGFVNVDFVKDGKYITVQNFYINAINGQHYPLEAPDYKVDTTIERYSGKYSLEELLADPTLGEPSNLSNH